ncbi:MAG: hypothetical protein M1816_006799 [Peltula sp. TS41687]|nr:MAG: hypothetical protein M1816_006799 [Peltula sp. TS41687]
MESATAPADKVGAPQSSHEPTDGSGYNSRVRTALQELREEIQEKETALNRLRESSESLFTEPSADPVHRLHQLRIIKTAFDMLTPAEPQLPSVESPLPTLLALRSSQHVVAGTKSSITDLDGKLERARTRLKKEESDLRDAKLITAALESRINSLQQAQSERLQQSPDDSVKDVLVTLQKKRLAYDREVKTLVKAFNRFIDRHLASMLEAEDEGGPVVGGATENDRGRFGQASSGNPKDSGSMVTEELRSLTEELLNASVSRDRSNAYVDLSRDSVAARFLVRSKIAEFGRGDASRIRLIGFGRPLDD